MPSWTLHNADNTIRIPFCRKIWLRLREKQKKNLTKHFSLLFSALSTSRKAPAKASRVLRTPPHQDRQQLGLLLVYLRGNPTKCSLFMLIYYTFSPLIKRLRSSKYCNNFFFSPPPLFLSLPPSLLLLLLPGSICSHWWLFDQRKRKLLKLIRTLSARLGTCQTPPSRPSVVSAFASDCLIDEPPKTQNQLCVVSRVKRVRFRIKHGALHLARLSQTNRVYC